MIKYDFMYTIPCLLQEIGPCLITQCIHLRSTFEYSIQDGANSGTESILYCQQLEFPHSPLQFFASGGWNFRFRDYFQLVARCGVHACARCSYTIKEKRQRVKKSHSPQVFPNRHQECKGMQRHDQHFVHMAINHTIYVH